MIQPPDSTIYISHSKEDTQTLGKKFASKLRGGDIFALVGDVGCGKTEFVRGILSSLSPEASVSSPSFSIVNSYDTYKFTVHHFDFYRITHIDELFEIGFDEYFSNDTVVLIEWADMYEEALPKGYGTVRFEAIGENERKISFV